MPVSPPPPSAPPFSSLASSLRRILLLGAAAALLAAAAGVAIEIARFGASESAALERVQREVRRTMADTASDLQSLATAASPAPEAVAAAGADRARLRPLFDRVDAALTERDAGTFGVTVYDAAGAPLVWGGRPSDVTADRIAGPAALFVAPGPRGPRLVQIHPIVDGARRLGTVAAERVFVTETGVGRPAGENFVLDTSRVRVVLRAIYEGAGATRSPDRFAITAPAGDALLEGEVAPEALARARADWRRVVGSAVLLVVAITLLLFAGPLLSWRHAVGSPVRYSAATIAVVALLVAARVVLRAAAWIAPPGSPLLSADAASLAPLFGSPADFLVNGLLAAALIALAADAIERGRRARRRVSVPRAWFVVMQAAAGALVAGAAAFGYERFLRATLGHGQAAILHFSLHPWTETARIAINAGLLLYHVAWLGAGVLVLRLASTWWHARPHVSRTAVLAAWLTGAAAALLAAPGPTIVIVAACVAFAALTGRVVGQYRNASQAAQLIILFLGLFLPSLVAYPAMARVDDDARRRLIETRLAAQVAAQRSELLRRLRLAIDQIDRIETLPDLVDAASAQPGTSVPTDTAFLVWSQTELATYRLSSAVELYAGDGALVGRFALNLPEYSSTPQRWIESGCGWDVFGENLPFGSDERPLLHAGRRLCARAADTPADADRQRAGSIVVHAVLDYTTLPFISSQSPYFELFRPSEPAEGETAPGRDVEFVVYGWGRMPAYTSTGQAWPLDEAVFARVYASRDPFWTRVERDDRTDEVYFFNDRSGIYALGYPRVTPIGHLVNLAELATLAGLVFVGLVVGGSLFTAVAQRRPTSGRQLLREIRASFYRKLFLAFVLASIVPVIALAFLTRTYIAAQLRAGIDSAAVRTAAVARRVIEEYTTLQQRGAGAQPALADDLMVEISRVIDQDVNIFAGARLSATSERDLFASGLLPTRTPGDVYRAIALDRLPSFVGREQVGASEYVLAAAPVRAGDRDAILTVPLTLQEQETEREIDELDRRVLLAAMIFIIAGAAIGYSMAERIADPVNRLTRATRRIARGDFDARIAATSADELRRLVEDFNSMAAELKRQSERLERTHRLEAWAEMARQVAHDIKNPLTPIQLSAEHLQRVHADRGEPLSPVLQDCVATILSQVRLLRQISAEFSSFASAPNPRPEPTGLGDVVREVVDPYATGLAGRIRITLDLPDSTPPAWVDRTLLARALTNVIENALHAMPWSGALTIRAAVTPGDRVALAIGDTGVGMDPEDLERIFEPYFSTRTTGTGLGLTIAKRNIEANGGTIRVASTKGAGTTVTIELPLARRERPAAQVVGPGSGDGSGASGP